MTHNTQYTNTHTRTQRRQIQRTNCKLSGNVWGGSNNTTKKHVDELNHFGEKMQMFTCENCVDAMNRINAQTYASPFRSPPPLRTLPQKNQIEFACCFFARRKNKSFFIIRSECVLFPVFVLHNIIHAPKTRAQRFFLLRCCVVSVSGKLFLLHQPEIITIHQKPY